MLVIIRKKGAPYMKKKTVLLVAATAAVASCGTAVLLPQLRQVKTASTEIPSYYLNQDENLESITQIVGERACVSEPESASSESGQEEESSASDSSNSSSVLVYRYYPVPDATISEDVSAYVDYLTSEKQFLDVTDTVPSETDQTVSQNTAEEAVSYTLAGPSADPSSYLTVTIQEFSDSYTITPQKEAEAWNQVIARLWEEQESIPETEPEQITLDTAEQSVASADMNTLGLSGDKSQYTFIADRGLILYDNIGYYQVNAYRRNDTGTLDYTCSYLLNPYTSQIVYRYDESNASTTDRLPA